MAVARGMKYEADGKVYFTNGTGGTLPIRSIVVVGDRVGVLAQELADGAVGIAYVGGVWPMPVLTSLTPAEGDVLGFDATDGEFNDDLAGNTITAVVCIDSAGALCQVTDHQWMLIR